MNRDNLEALQRPFDQSLIRSRRGQGNRTYLYVRAKDYIDRLNSLPCGWELILDELKIINDTDVLVRGHLTIDGQTRSDIGGASMVVSQEGEVIGNWPDLAKKAVSDLLKRCARHFGLGNHLWSIDDDEAAKCRGGNGRPAQPAETPRGNGNGRNRCATGTSNGNRLTQRQLSAIWSMGRSLGLSADQIRERSVAVFGAVPEQLSKSDASTFIQELGEGLSGSATAAP